jgi:hypothetical protein
MLKNGSRSTGGGGRIGVMNWMKQKVVRW